jgi:hypothetical protein
MVIGQYGSLEKFRFVSTQRRKEGKMRESDIVRVFFSLTNADKVIAKFFSVDIMGGN